MSATSPQLSPPDPVMVLGGHSPVTSIAFGSGPHTLVLFSGHQDGKVTEWNTSTQRAKWSSCAHNGAVLWLTNDPMNPCVLYSQGRDGAVRIWAATDSEWTPIGCVESSRLVFCNSALIFHREQRYLTVPTDETAEINVFSMDMSEPFQSSSTPESLLSIKKFSLMPRHVKLYGMCMKMCPVDSAIVEKPRLIVAYESGSIVLWDVFKKTLLSELRMHEESAMCVACWMNQDTGEVNGLSGSTNNEIHAWKIANDEISKKRTVSATNAGFNDIAIRSDGKIFLTGGWDSAGRVFGLSKLRPLAVLSYHRQSVQCVQFSMDKYLATGSKDGYIAIWDVYKDK